MGGPAPLSVLQLPGDRRKSLRSFLLPELQPQQRAPELSDASSPSEAVRQGHPWIPLLWPFQGPQRPQFPSASPFLSTAPRWFLSSALTPMQSPDGKRPFSSASALWILRARHTQGRAC